MKAIANEYIRPEACIIFVVGDKEKIAEKLKVFAPNGEVDGVRGVTNIPTESIAVDATRSDSDDTNGGEENIAVSETQQQNVGIYLSDDIVRKILYMLDPLTLSNKVPLILLYTPMTERSVVMATFHTGTF